MQPIKEVLQLLESDSIDKWQETGHLFYYQLAKSCQRSLQKLAEQAEEKNKLQVKKKSTCFE